MTNKPLNKFRDKSVRITVWPGKNGGYQCRVYKEYKPKDSDEWKKTDSFFPDELERLEKLCADARRWMHEQATQAEPTPHEIAKADGYMPQQPSFFDEDDIPF